MTPEERYIKALREVRGWRKDPLTAEEEEEARSWFRSLKPKWKQESMASTQEGHSIILHMSFSGKHN